MGRSVGSGLRWGCRVQRRGLGIKCSESQLHFTPALGKEVLHLPPALTQLLHWGPLDASHILTSLAPWHSGSVTNALLGNASQLALSEITSLSAEAS